MASDMESKEKGHSEPDEADNGNISYPIEDKPPNGGLVAWLQAFGGHLVVFNVWGYTNSYGIFQAYYTSSLLLPASTVSWVGSIQLLLIFLIGTFSGRAFDAGYHRALFWTGCTLQLVGIFMTSICTKYWQLLLAQGICQGLGDGLLFCPIVALISTYFTTKRSLAIASAACGAATGGIIFPLIAQQLLPKVGFAWTVRTMGLVVLVNSAIILAVARTRLPPRRTSQLIDLASFKELPYSLYAISMFFTLWATYFSFSYVRPHSLNILHASESTSFTLLLIINGMGVPGRLIPAYLADRYFGVLPVFVPTILFAGLCVFLWATVSSLTGEIIWVVFFGLFGGGVQSLFPTALASLTKDPSKRGTRIGMVFSIVSVACLTGPPLAGKLVAADGGEYIGAQVWGGTCLVLGASILSAAWWASRARRQDITSRREAEEMERKAKGDSC